MVSYACNTSATNYAGKNFHNEIRVETAAADSKYKLKSYNVEFNGEFNGLLDFLPKIWVLQGRNLTSLPNDMSASTNPSWTTLNTITGNTSPSREVTISAELPAYNSYRIVFVQANGLNKGAYVKNLQFYGVRQ